MDRYRLDKTRIIRGFNRAAADYEAAALLPREVRTRLLERLDYLSVDPAVVVDMGAATGVTAQALSQRYPQAGIVAVDISPEMIGRIGGGNSRIHSICADVINTPLPDHCADLIFSNLMLPWSDDLDTVLAEFRRLIVPQGAVTFSTFGPDTLIELRQAWQRVDSEEHVHAFFDMHDIGDALMRAGFAEPVMDVECITMTYSDLDDLVLDLRRMGSLNALPGRRKGLTGRHTADRLNREYESFRAQGRLPATFEVIYGQAWGPLSRRSIPSSDGTTRVPVGQVGRRQT